MHHLQAPEPLVNEHQLFKDQLLRPSNQVAIWESCPETGRYARSSLQTGRGIGVSATDLNAPALSGEITPDMKISLELIERLRKELPNLSEDHHTIIRMLEDFDNAVRTEGKTEFSPFSSNLIHHAHAEEGILFPAAILIGEYLRLKL